MDEALLSVAIHHGFLFRKLALGGENDRTEADNGRQRDTQTKLFPSHLNSAWKKNVMTLKKKQKPVKLSVRLVESALKRR